MSTAFEKRLHKEIPISKTLGARPVKVSNERVIIEAPLAPNTNHKLTAFGGSVYSIAVLSCWALVSETLSVEELDVEYVVVQDGKIDYLAPVERDFSAEAVWPSAGERDKFLANLKKRGLARCTLRSTVSTGKTKCAALEARFVAELRKAKGTKA